MNHDIQDSFLILGLCMYVRTQPALATRRCSSEMSAMKITVSSSWLPKGPLTGSNLSIHAHDCCYKWWAIDFELLDMMISNFFFPSGPMSVPSPFFPTPLSKTCRRLGWTFRSTRRTTGLLYLRLPMWQVYSWGWILCLTIQHTHQ